MIAHAYHDHFGIKSTSADQLLILGVDPEYTYRIVTYSSLFRALYSRVLGNTTSCGVWCVLHC